MQPDRKSSSLLLAFAAAITTALLFLFLFFNIGIRNRKYTYEDSKKLAREISRNTASDIREYFSLALVSARSVRDRALIYRKLGGAREDVTQMMRETLINNPHFMGVWTMWEPNAFDKRDKYFSRDTLYDPQGTMSMAYFKFEDSLFYERNDPGDFQEDFYTLPKNTRKELILDPYDYQYHGHDYIFYQTTAVVPVLVDDAFLGVFGIDINLERLQNRLNHIRFYETGYLSLITGSGIIVSHFDTSFVGKNIYSILPVDDTIRYSLLREGKELTLEIRSEFTGEEVFRFFYPVPVGSGIKPWHVMIEIPVDKATIRSKQLQYTAYATVILGLLVLLYLFINIADRKRYEKSILESMRTVEESNRIVSQNERKLRAIFDLSFQFVGLLTVEGKLIEANRTALEFAGIELKDVAGKYFWDTSWWSHSSAMQERLKEAFAKARGGQHVQFEATHVDLDSREHYIIASLSPVTDEYGNVVLIIPGGFDITDRRKAELALEASEKNFRNIFDKTKHGILILGQDLKVLAVNQAITEITGYSLEPDSSMFITDFLSPDNHEMVRERLDNISRGISLTPYEFRIKSKTGKMLEIITETSQIDYYGQEAYLVMVKDVTFIKEAEQKVLEAIINTEENERSRIAQELHDGLGPVLSTIKIYFQVYNDTQEEAKKVILYEKLSNTIEEAIKGVSEISHNISPHVLRNYGFYAALKQFTHRIALTNIVNLRLDCQAEPDVSQTQGLSLYRAVTELINNSIKHSGCRNIVISIWHSDGNLQVDYTDDGIGFDVSEVRNKFSKGSGVHNIFSRITALQGYVDIDSSAGKGMQATIRIPI
jgi:PAS domain S-box-containing protein